MRSKRLLCVLGSLILSLMFIMQTMPFSVFADDAADGADKAKAKVKTEQQDGATELSEPEKKGGAAAAEEPVPAEVPEEKADGEADAEAGEVPQVTDTPEQVDAKVNNKSNADISKEPAAANDMTPDAVSEPAMNAASDENGEAAIGDTVYDTLAEAVTAAASGDTIKLLKNIDAAAVITISGKKLTINGDGHSINRTAAYKGTIFNIKDSSIVTFSNLTMDGGAPGWTYTYKVKTESGYAPECIVVTAGGNDISGDAQAIIVRNSVLNFKDSNLKNFQGNKQGNLINSAGTDITFTGSKIEHNRSTNASSGGALYVSGGTLTLRDTDIICCGIGGNKLGGNGGAAYLTGSVLDVKGGKFEKNFSGSNSAVFGISKCIKITMDDVDFIENVLGNDGGVFQANNNGITEPVNYTFTNVRTKKNNALAHGNQSLGGFAFISDSNWSGSMTFKSCTFTDNEACEGVINNNNYNLASVYEGCTFTGNLNACLAESGDTTIRNCVFKDNVTEKGGAVLRCRIYTFYKVSDTEISNNDGQDTAGAVMLSTQVANTPSTAEFTNCSITGNKAANGGAFFLTNGCILTLGNGTEVTGNSAKYGGGAVIRRPRIESDFTQVKDCEILMKAGSKLYGNTASDGGDDIYIGHDADHGTMAKVTLIDAKDMDVSDADGYKIIGWYFDNASARYDRNSNAVMIPAFSPVTFTPDEDGNMYIKAATSVYTITYDPNGGVWKEGTSEKRSESSVITQGATIWDAPTRDGYEFVEWKGSTYQPGEAYNEKDENGYYVSDTLVAQWKKVENDTPSDDDDDSEGDDDSSKGVKTGDDNNLKGWIAMLLLATAGAGGAAVYRRKRREDQ